MKNLLKETIEELERHGKTFEDIDWVGSSDGYIPLDTFKQLADVEYHRGYGCQEVASDLIIVGKDFYMTREEYDGSEWWRYCALDLFKKPVNELKVTKLVGGTWDSLKELQERED